MKEREAARYLRYWELEPDDALERTRGHLSLRKTFGLTAVVSVGTVLLGLLFVLGFHGRAGTTISQAQTVQAVSQDSLAPAGPLAPQDESASESPYLTSEPYYPRASYECMGYWCYIVSAFYAGPG